MEDLLRLACIAIILDYRFIFLNIIGNIEKDIDEFINMLDSLNGNFDKIDRWMNDFIQKVKHIEAQALVSELWEKRKKEIDTQNFEVRQFLK